MSSLAWGPALSGKEGHNKQAFICLSITLFKLTVREPTLSRQGRRTWNLLQASEALWEKENCCWQVCLAPEIDPVPPTCPSSSRQT